MKDEEKKIALQYAIKVFGKEIHAKEWLEKPNYGLGWKIPYNCNINEVLDLLGRIEYGVF